MGIRAEDSLIGQTLDGRYRIEKILGVGGMGAVYRARNVHFDTPCAVKIMRGSESDSAKRFLAEARRTFKIQHPNCVEVTDCGVVENGALLYLTMEILEGRTLGEELERDGPIDPYRVAHIGAQVASAISCAHALGYVHRDLKPDNIMLLHRGTDPDFVKVLDFGLAKLYDTARLENTRSVMSFTQDGMIFGTPHYMSPEQAQGKKLDPRSDLYSLGVVLYEAISGQVPFDHTAQVEVLIAHVKEEPRSLGSLRRRTPGVLKELVHELLRKDPNRRPANADVVAARLHAFATPTSSPGRVSPKLASSETIQLEAAPSERPTTPERVPKVHTIRSSPPVGSSNPPGSIPPEVASAPTTITHPLGPETLATIAPPRSRIGLIAVVLLGLFAAGALLAWAVSRSSKSGATATIDAAAADATAATPPIDATAKQPIDAAPTPDAAVPDAPTSDRNPKPEITAARKRSMARLRELARTSSTLTRLVVAQKAYEADRSYSRARMAFANALLAAGGAQNREKACRLLRGTRRYKQAGCGN